MSKRARVGKGKWKHSIQVRFAKEDEGRWALVEQMVAANGLAHASSLCEVLLAQEATRLGLDWKVPRPALATGEGEEHRMNVRVTHSLWIRGQERAGMLGLDTLSDLCRMLLEKDLATWEREVSETAARKKGKKR